MSEFQFGIPLPNEFLAEAQRQHDLHNMARQTVRHDMFAFLESLDEDQSKQFSLLVRTFANDEDGSYAKYIDGYFSALRERKFGVCPGCGVNHDEVPEDMRPNEPSADYVQGVSDDIKVEAEEIKNDLQIEAARVGTHYVLTEFDQQHMEEYNLDDLRDEDDRATLLGFVCLGCGMRYISIADRMLRPPGIEGCNGCQLKSGHG